MTKEEAEAFWAALPKVDKFTMRRATPKMAGPWFRGMEWSWRNDALFENGHATMVQGDTPEKRAEAERTADAQLIADGWILED